MSAEAITFDSLEIAGQSIPVSGESEESVAGYKSAENTIRKNDERDLDDPNVRVPEGMSRFYIDFTTQKPAKKNEDEETIAVDEAIAEDAKSKFKVASPNSRKVATSWEDCKAKDKATCPYHGAAFMRDQFNQIFQKYGFNGAEVRVAPYGSDNDPMPAYRMYFNLPKNFDKKQLQKAFSEMMKIPGVGKLNADDMVDKKYHTEPEDKELSYDIEEFDPNIDPNDEMKADLEREKAEAEKKAAEEKAKEEAEEKSKAEAAKKAAEEAKKAEEEAKKQAQEQLLKSLDAVGQGCFKKYGVLPELPTDGKGRFEYIKGLLDKMNLGQDDALFAEAQSAYDNYVAQEQSFNAIKDKLASTKNHETKEVLQRLSDKSEQTLKQKDADLMMAIGNVENDLRGLVSDCYEENEKVLAYNVGNLFGKATMAKFDMEEKVGGPDSSIGNECKILLSQLNGENQKAYLANNNDLLNLIKKQQKEFSDKRKIFEAYQSAFGKAIYEGKRWDEAAALLDDDSLENSKKAFVSSAGKLFASYLQNLSELRKAVKAQEVSEQTKGSTADAADVSSLSKMTDKYIKDAQQKELFAQGVQKLPAKFAKFVLQGVSYKKGKGHSWARHEQFGQSLINLGAKDQNRMGHTLTHELGHGFAYKLGFVHDKPIPPQIQDFMRIMDDEGRDAMKTVLGTYAPPKKGKLDNYAKVKLWATTDMQFKGMSSDKSHETWDEIRDSNDILGLSDVFGCVNGGGFVGHAGGVYKSDWRRGQEMFANGVAALAGYHKSIEKLFPKSLAKLREIIENANLAYT